MADCKVMVKASLEKVKASFQQYGDMEFSQKEDWILDSVVNK